MAKTKDITVTNLGTQAIADIVASGGKLTYTKAVLSSQDFSEDSLDQVKGVTTLTAVKEAQISNLGGTGSNTVLSASFDNTGLKQDLRFSSVGWFAKKDNGNEFLFAISRFDGIQVLGVPEPGTSENQGITMQVGLNISQGQVTVVQTQAGVAKVSDVTQAVNSLTERLNNFDTNKANKSDVYTKQDIDSKVYDKSTIDNILSRSFFNKQGMDKSGNLTGIRANATKQADGGYSFNIWSNDWTASKLKDVMNQVNSLDTNKANKADVYDKSTVDQKVNDAKSSAKDLDLTQYAKAADVQGIRNLISNLRPDNNAETLPDGYDLNNHFQGWRRAINTDIKNRPWDTKTDTLYFGGNIAGDDGLLQIAINIGKDSLSLPKIAVRSFAWGRWTTWSTVADTNDINNLNNIINTLSGNNMLNSPDFNGVISAGSYYVANPGANRPPNASWGNLVVFGGKNGGSYRIEQLYFPDDSSPVYYRMKVDGEWHAWKQLADNDSINILQNGFNNLNANKADKAQVNIAGWIFRQIQNSNSWSDIFGINNPNNVLTSLRIDAGGSGPLLNDYAAGVGFGGADTKAVLSVAYQSHQARITGGNGSGPVWSEDVAWKSDINNLQNQITELKETQPQIRTFSNETDAMNWQKAAPSGQIRIAMIQG